MMCKRVGTASIIALVLLAGCALKPATWSKRNVSMAQGEKDMATCSKNANLLNIYGDKYDDGKFFVAGSILGKDPDKPGILFKDCMIAKGYIKIK